MAKYPNNEFAPTVMFQLSELYVKRAALRYQQEMTLYENNLKQYDAGLLKSEPIIPRINLSDAIAISYKILEKYPRVPFRDKVLYRIALCHLEEGNKEKVKDYFSQLIAESKNSQFIDEAYFRLGEYYFDQKQYQQAIENYSQLLNSWDNPYFDMALYKLGWSYYNIEKYPDAIGTFIYLIEDVNLVEQADTEVLGKTKADLRKEALQYAAICFAEFGGPAKAKEFLKSKKEKEYTKEILLSLADVYQKRNFYNQAIESLNVLLNFYPDSPNAPKYQQEIIKNYELAGDREKANQARALLVSKYGPGSQWLSHILKADLRQEVLDVVEEFLFTLGTDAQAEAQQTKSKIHYQLAIDRYRSLLTKFPNSKIRSKVLFYLAECFYDVEDFKAAAETYNDILANHPESEFRELAAYNRILSYDQLLKSKPRPAQEQLTISDFLGNPQAVTDTFRVDNAVQAQFLLASNDFCRLYPGSTKLPEVLMKYAEMFFDLGHYTLAQACYQKVINLDSSVPNRFLPQAYTMTAQSAFKAGHYKEAEDWFARLAQLYPDSARYVERANKMIASSRFKVAESFKESGATAQAALEFEKVSRIAPDSAVAERAQFEAALQYENIGQQEKAISLYELLFQKYPKSALVEEALFKAGILCEELQDWNRAAANYLNVYRSNNASKFAAKALFNAAKSYENLGDSDNARTYYGEYLKVYKQAPDRYLEAAFRKAEIAYNLGNYNMALADLKFVVSAYRQLGNQGEMVEKYFPANAQFLVGEILFRNYVQIKLVPPLERNLKRKKKLFEAVIKAYTAAARFKVAEWATASSHQIGATFEEFANFFLNATPPDNLTGEALQQYNQKVNEKVLPFRKKALAAYQSTVEKAYKNNIHNTWVQQSRHRVEVLTAELGLSAREIDPSTGS
ncbi:MAG: tetratricopeptide repeat protein [bacterium]